MTAFGCNSGSPGIPSKPAQGTARADPGWPGTWEDALAASRQLLAETVDAINPGTPAVELLACLERYRAHLGALLAIVPSSINAAADDPPSDRLQGVVPASHITTSAAPRRAQASCPQRHGEN